MNSLKIKKNDTVVILSGKDRGKQGKVLGTVPSEGKVVVEGCNMVTCHIKPRRQGEEYAADTDQRPAQVVEMSPKSHSKFFHSQINAD